MGLPLMQLFISRARTVFGSNFRFDRRRAAGAEQLVEVLERWDPRSATPGSAQCCGWFPPTPFPTSAVCDGAGA